MLEIKPEIQAEEKVRYRLLEELGGREYVERASVIVHDGCFDEDYNAHETVSSVRAVAVEEAVAEIARVSGLGHNDALDSLLESSAEPYEPCVYRIYTRHITETRDDIDVACERAAYLSATLDNTLAAVTEPREHGQQILLTYEGGELFEADLEEQVEDA